MQPRKDLQYSKVVRPFHDLDLFRICKEIIDRSGNLTWKLNFIKQMIAAKHFDDRLTS